MKVTNIQLKKFKEVFMQEFGIELSDEDAVFKAEDLIFLALLGLSKSVDTNNPNANM